MKRLPVYRFGRVAGIALVDDEDFHLVSHLRWLLSAKGYAVCHSKGSVSERQALYMHRVILGLERGDTRQGDHINRSAKLDCRRFNLRVVSRRGNQQNVSSHRDGTSRFRGVSWSKDKQKWRASSRMDGRQFFHGYFDDEEEAALAAKKWRLEHMPFAVD